MMRSNLKTNEDGHFVFNSLVNHLIVRFVKQNKIDDEAITF